MKLQGSGGYLVCKTLENGDLEITLETGGKDGLRENIQDSADSMKMPFDSALTTDATMCDVFEGLLANTELEWCSSDITGDLTSAPMLAVYGEERLQTPAEAKAAERGLGPRMVGNWPDENGVVQTWVQEPAVYWYFADYQLVSPVEQLLEKGCTVFTLAR